jgi:hypothetical protein
MIFVMCGAEIPQKMGFLSLLINNLGEDFHGHEKRKERETRLELATYSLGILPRSYSFLFSP